MSAPKGITVRHEATTVRPEGAYVYVGPENLEVVAMALRSLMEVALRQGRPVAPSVRSLYFELRDASDRHRRGGCDSATPERADLSPSPSGWTTGRSAASQLGVTPQRVRQLAQEGKLPGAWLDASGRWCIPTEAIEARLAAQEPNPMARTALALTAQPIDAVPVNINPDGNSVGGTHGITLERIILIVTHTGSSEHDLTIRAGTALANDLGPHAGPLVVPFAAGDDTPVTKILGPFVSSRFAQKDGGALHVDFEAGFTGTVTAVHVPSV